MTRKKTLTKVAFLAMLCCSNMVLATDRVDRDEDRLERETAQNTPRHQETLQNEGRVSYQDFIRMDDQQIQKVRTVIIPLSESNFDLYKLDAFNRKLEQNRNIMLVLDCAGASRIGGNCLRSVKANHVKIIHAENVAHIGNYFLAGCSRLTSLDLRPFTNLRGIGEHFLADCRGLTTLDLSPLSNVTYIAGLFLYNCTGLTTLDLSPLSNVTDIGGGFLFACAGLTTLDLSPLSNVIYIGQTFLSHCRGLTTLDLSPLSNVRSIGLQFLSGCSGLTTLDLSPLSNVSSIGVDFLLYTRLESVTIPENWRFEDHLPRRLISIRSPAAPQVVQNDGSRSGNPLEDRLPDDLRSVRSPAAPQTVQNDRSRSGNPQPYINQLRERNIDPKRDGSDYTEIEFNIASAFLQGAEQSQNGYLARLEQVFSTQRAVKLLEDIHNGDDHSSDSENSDH